jgi:phosphoketolase
MSSVMRRRSALAGVPFWMFMASSCVDRGKITSTNTTAPSPSKSQSAAGLTHQTATLATYREAI